MSIIIDFEVVDPKLISVNEQYLHPVRKTSKGRYVSYFCKSPGLKDVQSFYEEVLKDKILEEDIQGLKDEMNNLYNRPAGLSLTIEIGLPRNELYEHDVTNYIKALEDCITSRTKIDDNRNIIVMSMKSITPDDQWKLRVIIQSIPVRDYSSIGGYFDET